ncbi:MAG: CFI-box-CTERM domain-containing protein [Bdellovibrionota bacterium]
MPSKLVNFLFKVALSFNLCVSAPAFATVTVQSLGPGASVIVPRISGFSAYYAVNTFNAAAAFVDTNAGFRAYDLAASQLAGSSHDEILYFLVSSDSSALTTGDGSTPYVLSVWSSLTTATYAITDKGVSSNVSFPRPMPLAYVGLSNGSSAFCTGGIGVCFSNGANTSGAGGTGSTDRNYATIFTPGASTVVGVYLKDFCEDSQKNIFGGQSVGQFCNVTTPGNVAAVTLGSATPATIHFMISRAQLVTPSNDYTFANAGAVDQSAFPLTLRLTADVPTFSCSISSGLYFPGDGEILIDTNRFTLTNPASVPGQAMIVVAKKGAYGGATIANASYPSLNDIQATLSMGSGIQNVGGLTNSLTLVDGNTYDFKFAGRDASGLISYLPATPTTNICTLPAGRLVRTANIEGFLKKGNCFIATAAFGEPNAAPVAMLRSFRDRLLYRSSVGRSFASWYYSWSPEAAQWLVSQPMYRFFVLLFLIPVQIAVWLVLHPIFSGSIFIFCAALVVFSRARRRVGIHL